MDFDSCCSVRLELGRNVIMNELSLLEIYGYIGSVLVVVSMLMSSVIRLRLINMTGSIISGTYSLIIGSMPLVLMNFSIIAINCYNLYKLLKTRKEYDLFEIKPDDSSLNFFINSYKNDILIYFPDFQKEIEAADRAFMVCCNGTMAGVLVGETRADGELDVVIDYTSPAYRDCSIAKYAQPGLVNFGVKKLTFDSNCAKAHDQYMKKVGFTVNAGKYSKML